MPDSQSGSDCRPRRVHRADLDRPVFDEIHFTGAFQHLESTSEEEEGHAAKRAIVSHKKRTKAEVGSWPPPALLARTTSNTQLLALSVCLDGLIQSSGFDALAELPALRSSTRPAPFSSSTTPPRTRSTPRLPPHPSGCSSSAVTHGTPSSAVRGRWTPRRMWRRNDGVCWQPARPGERRRCWRDGCRRV